MTDKNTNHPKRLRGMNVEEISELLDQFGQPAYRAKQIAQWLYQKNAASYDEMTNLPKDLRARLTEEVPLGGLEHIETVGGADETQKLVFRTHDGHHIESVLMRDVEDDEDEEPAQGSTAPQKRLSLCVSSQVGCGLACAFCVTGLGGFKRNLTTDEILDQVIQARRIVADDERVANLVFMGMGEPLLNLDHVIPALKILVSPHGFEFATRRITVSTAGVIPGIRALAESETGVNLAVSLNATTQEQRDRLMPGVKKWPLDDLLKALSEFPLLRRRRITFEYVLLDGVNDSDGDLKRMVEIIEHIPSKINFILFNPDPALPFVATPEKRAQQIRDHVAQRHYTVALRRSKGREHKAACGQLAAHFRRNKKESNQ